MEQKPQVSGLVLLKSAVESEKFQGRLQQCVAENKGAFASSILDLYSGDQQLQTCEPNAILTECLKAAALNLPINKALGFAYVVVYNNNVKRTDPQTGAVVWVKVPTPTFILGYKGYIQLAMRTGQYRTMNADVVYEGELRKADKLSGAISFDGIKKSDKIVGYFAYFELINGFQKTLYMSLDDMAAYALRYSPSLPKNTTKEELKAKANSGEVSKKVGWLGNFNDMALKTCVRRIISKWGYMSIQMQQAFADEIKAENDAIANRQEVIETTETIDVTMEAEEVPAKGAEAIPAQAAAAEVDEGPGY